MSEQMTNQIICRCGTGNYCHKHHQYATKQTAQPRGQGGRCAIDVFPLSQRCGGGVRVIKANVPA